jgi:hypothetical protein
MKRDNDNKKGETTTQANCHFESLIKATKNNGVLITDGVVANFAFTERQIHITMKAS